MEDSMSVMRRRNERQGDGMEFRAAAQKLATEANGTPIRDEFYNFTFEECVDLLARAMRIAVEETQAFAGIRPGINCKQTVAARIESRISNADSLRTSERK